MPRTSAIIVTRNNRNDIGQCLTSLRASRVPVDEIVVVDNDSRDGTADFVRREFPDVCVLDFWDNPGFGEGNNRGARAASGEYLFLLNPDAAAAPDCVGHLLSELERHAVAGIAVPKVVLASEPSIINSAGLHVSSIGYGWDRGYLEWDTGQYDRTEQVLAGSGCALMIRADVFRALGGFDAAYFMYYEDLDLCWRSSIAGRHVRYVPAAMVYHDMKVSGRSEVYNDYYDHRNRIRMLLKNESAGALLRKAPGLLLFEAGSMWAYLRWRQWSKMRLRARAWGWNVARLWDTWSQRRVTQRGRRVQDAGLIGLFAPGRLPHLHAALPTYTPAYEHIVDHARLGSTLTMGTNDVGALGLGWHGPEAFAGVASRWSSGYGIAFLAAPYSGNGATLTVRCASVAPASLVVRTDRVERGRFAIQPSEWHDVVVDVPLTGAVTRVELLAEPTFVPAELHQGSGDRRTLGVAVARMTLEARSRS